MYENIHGTIIINNPKMNTTHMFIKLFDWINKMPHIHIMKYYTSVRMHKLQLNSTIWMELTALKLGKKSNTKEDRNCDFILGNQTKLICEANFGFFCFFFSHGY